MLSALRDTALFFFDLSMSVVQCLLGSPGLLPVRPQMGHGALCCAHVGASRLAERHASHDFTAAGVTTPSDAHLPEVQEIIRDEIRKGTIRVRPHPDGGIRIVPLRPREAQEPRQ